MSEHDELPDEFAHRMRVGVSTMAVRERAREVRRRRRLAVVASSAAAAAVMGVIGWQLLGAGLGATPERDEAGPSIISTTPAPSTPAPSATPTPSEPAPTETGDEAWMGGVAAGEPVQIGERACGECGDAEPPEVVVVERYDVYVLCEGSGSVDRGGQGTWFDCSGLPAGAGIVELGVERYEGEPAEVFEASPDFDGQLAVVPAGQAPAGDAGGTTATVYVDCPWGTNGGDTVTIGEASVDCPAGWVTPTYGAWGVPIAAGELAPHLAYSGVGSLGGIRFVVDR